MFVDNINAYSLILLIVFLTKLSASVIIFVVSSQAIILLRDIKKA